MAAQKAGNRKKEMAYKRKATEAAASICKIFEALLEEDDRLFEDGLARALGEPQEGIMEARKCITQSNPK